MKKSVKKKHKRAGKKSFFKNRGISKIALLAIIALILAGAGGLYVFSQRSGGGVSTALPFVKPPLNPNCKYNDPELCKFVNNFPAQTNYSVASTSNFGGMTAESVYEISGEDKFRMVSKQNGKETSHMISIGDTTYTLDYNDNKWWKYTSKPEDPGKETEEDIKDQFKFDANEAEDKTTYRFIAKEACGSLTCFKYEMISPDAGDTKMFMWFDDRDYLMRKMRTEGKSSGVSESVYSYKNVSINAPSPVKEGYPYSAGGNSLPGYSKEEAEKMMQQYQGQGLDTSTNDSEVPMENSVPEEY